MLSTYPSFSPIIMELVGLLILKPTSFCLPILSLLPLTNLVTSIIPHRSFPFNFNFSFSLSPSAQLSSIKKKKNSSLGSCPTLATSLDLPLPNFTKELSHSQLVPQLLHLSCLSLSTPGWFSPHHFNKTYFPQGDQCPPSHHSH